MKGKIAVLIYFFIMIFEVFLATNAYKNFETTYGNKTFSNGFLGIVLCLGGYFLVMIVTTIIFYIFMKNIKVKSN
ncbi:hypothetical protein SAMN02910289_01903 [Lachnospiraceae bacterium RM5]|nr:hypothetical protein SAMN02910289_01903 [Lachnospiraceae bacterium RM5]